MKIQKIILSSLLVLFMAVMSFGFYLPAKYSASATGDEKIPIEINYGTKTDDFTPFDYENSKRMEGQSYKPDTSTLGSVKYYNNEKTYIDFVSPVNFKQTDSLYFWIYFDVTAIRPLNFYLKDGEGNYVEWSFTAIEVIEIFQKTTNSNLVNSVSNFDLAMYLDVSAVPYGWNLVELKFKKVSSQDKGEISFHGMTSNDLIAGHNFTAFGFDQLLNEESEDKTEGEGEILFYDFYKQASYTQDDAMLRIVDSQSYSVFIYNSAKKLTKKYYAGEFFDDILTFDQFFLKDGSVYKGAMWIGKHDFLKKANGSYIGFSEYTKLFDVILYNTTQKIEKTFEFGDGGFTLEQGSYRLLYKFYPNSDTTIGEVSSVNVINLAGENSSVGDYQEFTVSSYGSGIWFVNSSASGEVGKLYEINYNIHSAFFEENYYNEVSVSFSNEGVLELVELNQSERKIIVKCIGEGSTGIKLTLTSLRLLKTNSDELVDESFTFNVTKPVEDPNRTTKIILWTALGVLGGGALAYCIYLLIKSRKIEVK